MTHDARRDPITAALQILPAHLPSGHCILSTRVGLEVLAAFGVPATPVSVTVVAATTAWWAWWNAGHVGAPPPYSVYVKQGHGRPGRWPGHLVLQLADATLLDVDLRAFQRPAQGLMPPVAARIPQDATDRGLWTLTWSDGSVAYLVHPEDRSYRRAPDWTGNWRPYVGPAVRAVRTHLLEEAAR
jgi:hypothetical protein